MKQRSESPSSQRPAPSKKEHAESDEDTANDNILIY